MNRSMPGLPVHHQLPESTQTHVHRVSDAIQLSHPLSSPFPPSIRVFSNELTLCMRRPKYWSGVPLPSPKIHAQFNSVVSQSCPTLCNPMNLSTPGLPVHHQLPEFTQTHVHRVSDAIQPAISSSVIPFSSCPQSLPASESFPMSQLFA